MDSSATTFTSLEHRLALVEKLREYEMEEARLVQQALIPAEPLRADPIYLACKFRPVEEVGGDFLDYFWLTDGRLAFYLGDVAGKGLPAALCAALAVGVLRGLNKTGEAPNIVLELLNRRLRMRVVPGRFCAVQYAVFDPPSRTLRFANAGLPLPLHISARGCAALGGGGLPSGLLSEAHYELHSVQVAKGDAVLFLTDGLIEATNHEGEEFGIERLKEACTASRNESADCMLSRVFEAVDAFAVGSRQHDDMTAALLKVA